MRVSTYSRERVFLLLGSLNRRGELASPIFEIAKFYNKNNEVTVS